MQLHTQLKDVLDINIYGNHNKSLSSISLSLDVLGSNIYGNHNIKMGFNFNSYDVLDSYMKGNHNSTYDDKY